MTGHRREGSARTGRLGLCTDLYELRMVASYLRRGMTAPATFSLFVRPVPERPWYVSLGVEQVLEALPSVTFGPEELDELARIGFDGGVRDELAALAITTGEVWAVTDGTVVLAQEPILEVTAPLPVAQLLETAVINLVQYPTLVATKAARCALVADGRRLADFGFRRAHGLETGVEAALAAYLGGGFATSNVEAGRRYGIPTTGTMAHAYVQAFRDERDAFRSFASDHPEHSVLLVDTYDTVEGVRRAIEVCHELGLTPKGVRLDSGDLGALAVEARRLLDDAGFADAIVLASGGLDEVSIHELVTAGAPIDGFGVGTALTVSDDRPGWTSSTSWSPTTAGRSPSSAGPRARSPVPSRSTAGTRTRPATC
jgi:nicotinate phosphoribosyltransferase